MLFKNRRDAALQLIPHLEKYKNDNGAVLAVPRGGIPIGYYIAKKFNFPLEPILTKKIGHPWSEELAIGAVSLEDHVIDEFHNISPSYIENEVMRIRESLQERYKKFMGKQMPVNLRHKTVIIVDDGIATGNTLLAAIRLIKKSQPQKIIVAVPVTSVNAANKIKSEVDDFISLYTIEDFIGVGLYYYDFSEVSDKEVIRLLKEANTIENTA
jgi:putative phosphoribosyl transferase